GYGAVVLAILSPPVLMLLWDGQIDGVALLGFLALPWGIPLLIAKPTITIFALLARPRWVVWAGAFLALSFLVWGWWPAQVLATLDGRNQHPMAMGWQVLGWPIAVLGLVLLFFTPRSDPLRLMAAGSFLLPYLMPYQYVCLLPALGRLEARRQL